jgi:hypothetical protein
VRYRELAVALFWLAGMGACATGPHSPVGFRLPETGDLERGRAAFVELECTRCHSVHKADLPEYSGERPVHVVLGGLVEGLMTDGYLVSGIINPSHRFGRGLGEAPVSVEGESRMPDFNRSMTVRQLIDIVAFLQSKYELARPHIQGP